MDVTSRLSELGRQVRDASDRSADREMIIGRARTLMLMHDPPPRRRRWQIWAVPLAAMLGAALFLEFHSSRDTLSFQVGDPPRAALVGDWIAAGNEPLSVAFSQGSRLRLEAASRIRVVDIQRDGVEVFVERGSLSASVVSLAGTRWAFRAGPFEVRITGTAFEVAWDPSKETFLLEVSEGSVLVSGPLLPPGRRIVAGERLRVSIPERHMDLTRGSSAPPPFDPSDAHPAAELDDPAPAPERARELTVAATSAPSATSAGSTWRELVTIGDYKGALVEVDKTGFSEEIERGSADDLLRLADAARYSDEPAKAAQALIALRRRFGAVGESSFILGKIAADQEHQNEQAAAWFQTYLEEQPNGLLAEQAMGRLLELRRHTDPAEARSLASRYLETHPSGVHAELARVLAADGSR